MGRSKPSDPAPVVTAQRAARTTGLATVGLTDPWALSDLLICIRAFAELTPSAQQLVELTGREVEGVTALERTDDGWMVEVDVLEVRRIPDTTDVLATYELTLDEDGEIDGYRRLRRYVRGTPEDGRS